MHAVLMPSSACCSHTPGLTIASGSAQLRRMHPCDKTAARPILHRCVPQRSWTQQNPHSFVRMSSRSAVGFCGFCPEVASSGNAARS